MVSRTRLLPARHTQVFEAAARHQSLVRAAEELHVTHGAVSRQIQARKTIWESACSSVAIEGFF
jgi:predicted transcriptional regulator